MSRDWQYDYIIAGGDTLRDMDENGEPLFPEDREESTQIELLFIRYLDNHTYELRYDLADLIDRVMGTGINYQPNYGFWNLEKDQDDLILIHNKEMVYETRYEVLVLTTDEFVRKQIGGRINQNDTLGVAQEWIEVFRPKPDQDEK